MSPEQVEVETVPANVEDDGSIPLAGRPASAFKRDGIFTSATIGDGPHGSGGAEPTGDFDFYAVDAVAGNTLSIDTDTPTSFPGHTRRRLRCRRQLRRLQRRERRHPRRQPSRRPDHRRRPVLRAGGWVPVVPGRSVRLRKRIRPWDRRPLRRDDHHGRTGRRRVCAAPAQGRRGRGLGRGIRHAPPAVRPGRRGSDGVDARRHVHLLAAITVAGRGQRKSPSTSPTNPRLALRRCCAGGSGPYDITVEAYRPRRSTASGRCRRCSSTSTVLGSTPESSSGLACARSARCARSSVPGACATPTSIR